MSSWPNVARIRIKIAGYIALEYNNE